MIAGLNYLDLGLAIAAFAGVFWWMFFLCTKSGAQRRLERVAAKVARQPWDDDKPGGRGNR